MTAAPPTVTSARTGACPLDMNRRLLMGFLDRLQAEASFGPAAGCFDLIRLRDLAEEYLTEGTHPSVSAPSECLKLHDAVLWEDRRNRPFERLLARRFSHLLPKRIGDEGDPAPGAPLSRRLIPGLVAALSKMAGQAMLDEASLCIEALLTRHRESRLGLVDWPQLAAEPEVEAVLCDILLTAAHHFQNVDRRVNWLTQVINSHLPAPLPEDHDPAWRCDPARTRLLLRALYAPLAERLRDKTEAALLRRTFGEVAVAETTLLIAALEASASQDA